MKLINGQAAAILLAFPILLVTPVGTALQEPSDEPSSTVEQPLQALDDTDGETGTVHVILRGELGRDYWNHLPHISLQDAGSETSRHFETESVNDQGQVTFHNVPKGVYYVWALSQVSPAYLASNVEVLADQVVSVTLDHGPANLTGHIHGAEGRSTRHHLSWFLLEGSTRKPFQGGATIDPDGTYEIEGLVAGRYLLIYGGENIFPNTFEAKIRQGENTFDLALPTSRLDGVLVGETYEKRFEYEPGQIRVTPRGISGMGEGPAVYLDADEEQRFHVEHLPPNEYVIVTRGPSGREVFVEHVTIDISDEQVVVSLEPPESTGSVAGSVAGLPEALSKSGTRTIHVSAFARDQMGYEFGVWYQDTLDPDSETYQIDNLPEGTYGIFVSGYRSGVRNFWISRIEVRRDRVTNLDIDIPEGRDVQFTFVSDARLPHGWKWSLRMPSGDVLPHALFVGSGAFPSRPSAESFIILPFGEYSIEVVSGYDRRVSQPLRVEPGDSVQYVEVVVPSGEV